MKPQSDFHTAATSRYPKHRTGYPGDVLPLAFLLIFRLAPVDTAEYKQPQLAAAGKLVAVTFGSGDSILYAASHDQGKSFSKPSRIAEVPGLMLGRHRGPRIAITKSAIVVSAISNQQGDLIAWRSTDGGRTWSRGAAANQTPRAAREGLHAMIATRDGAIYAAWLDFPGGKGQRLMGARSDDNGATWSKNVLMYQSPDGTICECCHPSLAVGPDGAIHAMWRNSLGGDRDLYTAVSHDGGRSFGPAEKLGQGSWRLQACPMDGGGIAIALDGNFVSAFRRKQEVFLTSGSGPETLVSEGKDPAVAAGSEGVFVAWTGPNGVMAKLPVSTEPVRLDPDGSFPQLVSLNDGSVLAAWERKGEIEFQRLTSRSTQR